MRCRESFGRVTGVAALIRVTGAILVFCSLSDAHENHAPLPTQGVTVAGDTIMLSDKARKAIGLTTAKIEFGDFHRTILVNARVELPWYAQAMITSLVPGKIAQVLVRPGETVTPGQELARIVSTELTTLQLTLLQARAEVALARRLVDQRSALDQQGVIAGKTLLEAQATLADKSAALEISRQKLQALGLNDVTIEKVERDGEPLRHVSITSPIRGIITHSDVRIGQLVRPTDHLYHVVDPSTLWIVGDVLESDVRFLDTGQAVEATFTAIPETTVRGHVDHLGLRINRRTRTQGVVVTVNNTDGHLRPGMFGRIAISVQIVQQAIVCPRDAVVRSRTGDYLLVQRTPGKYENRRVKLGLSEDEDVEVLEGVFPGDHVVLVGNALLAALLGNEHKARVHSDYERAPHESHDNIVAVLHGTVELPTDQQALATPQVEGRVCRIHVEPSQSVSAGDMLAEVDSLQLRNVQLDLLQSHTQARLAEQSLKRLEGLSRDTIVPRRQIWEKQSELQTLELRAEALKRQLAFFGLAAETIERLERVDLTQHDSAAELVQTVPVRAPADGRIVGFNIVPGQVVHRDEALFEIHDLSRVWVKGYVFERDIRGVHLGQTAIVHFAAYPELETSGTVVRISPTMDEKERVLPVWVEVPNSDQRLKDGMLARVTLLAKSTGDELSGEVARIAPLESQAEGAVPVLSD